VKIAQYRLPVVEFSFIAHESRSSIYCGLQFIMCCGRKSIECDITIVQSSPNERHHKRLEDRPREAADDTTYSSQIAKTSGGDFG
jgi:hypothetical protein